MRDGGGVGSAGHCAKCERDVPAGPDICLGLIPGVSHACCGHGKIDSAYVCFGGKPNQDASTITTLTLRGPAALLFFELMKYGELLEPTD